MPVLKNCSQISKNVLLFQIFVHVLKYVHISYFFVIFKIVLHFTIYSKSSKFLKHACFSFGCFCACQSDTTPCIKSTTIRFCVAFLGNCVGFSCYSILLFSLCMNHLSPRVEVGSPFSHQRL